MTEFGSAEWFDRLVMRAADVSAAIDPPVVIEQSISDAPDDSMPRWHFVIGAGVRVVAGGAPNPTITLRCDRATAAALARGTTNAQRSISAGQLHIGGDLDSLVTIAPLLAELLVPKP
jgi:SCP-2 sterol transfer family